MGNKENFSLFSVLWDYKYPILVFLLVIAFAGVIFKFGLYNPYKDIFSIIEHVGTFAAAIFALMVITEMKNQQKTLDDELKELKKQTESTYLPYLMINESKYKLHIRSCRSEVSEEFKKKFPNYPVLWYSSDNNYEYRGQNILKIPLENIGFKSAKNVKIHIGYENTEFKKHIQSFLEKLDELDANRGYGTINTHYPGADTKNAFSYILPVNDAKTGYLISLPQDYVRLCSVFLYLQLEISRANTNTNNLVRCSPLPTPYLEGVIEYETIQNKKDYSHFKLNLSNNHYSDGFIVGDISASYMEYPDILKEYCFENFGILVSNKK